MEPSPLKLKLTPKKRRLSTEKTKCIFCEAETEVNTKKKSHSKGISAFLTALQSLKYVGDDDIAKYFETIAEYGPVQEIKFHETESDIYWHKLCYCTFTNRDHISRLQDKDKQIEPDLGPSSSKVQR